MNRLFQTLLLVLFSTSVFAQATDTIEVKKALGTVFLQNGKVLTPAKLLVITKTNPDAYAEMLRAKQNYDAGSVIGGIGGFLVGWPLGTAMAGGKPQWAMAAVGAGIIVASIPLSTAYTKHAKKAVNIYNDGQKQASQTKYDLKLAFTTNGVGLKINF